MSFICPERFYPFPQQLHDGNCLIIAPGIVLKTKLEPLSLSPVQPSHLCPLNLPTFFFFQILICPSPLLRQYHHSLFSTPFEESLWISVQRSNLSGLLRPITHYSHYQSQIIVSWLISPHHHHFSFVVYIGDFSTAIQYVQKK